MSIDDKSEQPYNTIDSGIGGIQAILDRMRAVRFAATSASPGLVGIAERLLKASRLKDRHFPEMPPTEPAWNILLDVYVATMRGTALAVTDVCIGSGGPPTTALRHIAILVAAGIASREHSVRDGRRVYVKLTPAGLERVEAYVSSLSNVLYAGG